MRVYIEKDGFYLTNLSDWGSKEDAYDFCTPGLAVDLCIIRRLRHVRIIINTGTLADDIFLDVHGSDLAALKKGMHENRRLRQMQKDLKADLSQARAEKKEWKKRLPFSRKRVSEE